MVMRNSSNQTAGHQNPSALETKMDRPQRGPFKGLRTKTTKVEQKGQDAHSSQQQHAVDDLEVKRHSHRRPDDFLPNPKILDSPTGRPQKKIWEGAYRNFLTLGKPPAATTTTHSPSGSDLSKSPATNVSDLSRSPDVNNKKSTFSILPGTKRLVTHVPSISGAHHRHSGSLPGNISSLGPPTPGRASRAQSMSTGIREDGPPTPGKAGRAHSMSTGIGEDGDRFQADNGEAETRPGPAFLRGMFNKSTSDGSVKLISRRTKNYSNGSSPDDLDSAMRHGMNRHSPEYNYIPRKQASPPVFPPAIPPSIPNVRASSQSDIPRDLDALLAGASSSPHFTVETSGMHRIASYGMTPHPMSASLENISTQYPYFIPQRESTGSFSYHQMGLNLEDDSHGNSSHSSELLQSQHRSRSIDQTTANKEQPATQALQSAGVVGSSLLAQQFAAHAETELNQQHHHHHPYEQQTYPQHVQYRPMYGQGQYHPMENNHNTGAAVLGVSPNVVVGGLETMLQDPRFSVNSSPSSMILRQHHHQQQQGRESPPVGVDPETKKVFTAFHNQARFARDATSAFLGEESPTAYHHSYVTYHMMMGGGGVSVPQQAYSATDLPSMGHFSTSLPLETVDEQNISIHKSMRILKPIHGTESWETGRRYLIAPAALAACPLPVVNRLSGGLVQSAMEAAESNFPQVFGTIDLGECLMTYIGDTHHLSLGQWSSCRLVLRQNYLLEFETSAPTTGPPRGYIHLQHARASKHVDFQNALELDFYASPCAKADRRTLMIRAETREECTYWIKCLNQAAQLRIEDLWDYEGDFEFGRGRYASVYPARRKTEKYHTENPDGTTKIQKSEKQTDKESALAKYDCALKIIDKAEFWRRVVKGRERADTLVRETATQAALTAKCGKIGSFLQLRGFFETSENIVIELELLEGTDLFKHISSKGVLPEHEAAMILRDMLTSLDAMNRVGLAHRDIKPANVLMCDREKDGVSVKVGDFGMSTFVGVDGLVRGRCGTPGYAAPELLTGGSRVAYTNAVDVFSAGVTLYVMLCGYEPFYGETEHDLIESNKRALIEFPEDDWGRISNDARDLVKKMTLADPRQRISAKDALRHPWITRLDEAVDDEPNNTGSKGQTTTSLALGSADLPKEGACVIS